MYLICTSCSCVSVPHIFVKYLILLISFDVIEVERVKLSVLKTKKVGAISWSLWDFFLNWWKLFNIVCHMFHSASWGSEYSIHINVKETLTSLQWTPVLVAGFHFSLCIFSWSVASWLWVTHSLSSFGVLLALRNLDIASFLDIDTFIYVIGI